VTEVAEVIRAETMADDSMDFAYGQVDEDEWIIDLDSLQIEECLGLGSAGDNDGGAGNRHDALQNKRAEIDSRIQGLNDNNIMPEEDRARMEQREREKKKSKTGEIQHLPPGIKVFSGQPFSYFTHTELDLVRDFKYQPKHQERGFKTEEQLLKALRNPLQFVMLLSPETTSKVIQSNEDYVAVCEFLIYSLIGYTPVDREGTNRNGKASATTNGRPNADGWTYDLYRKALFDLIRNYSFKEWKVTLKHLIVALLNFGADERLIVDQKFYDEALKPARLRESSKKNRFSLKDVWPHFFDALLKRMESEEEGKCRPAPSEADVKDYLQRRGEPLLIRAGGKPHVKHLQMTSIEKFVHLFTDLIVSFATRSHAPIVHPLLMPKLDSKKDGGPWGPHCLVLYYLMSTVCLDTHCLRLPSIQFNSSRVFSQLCNKFSTKQFWGDEEMQKENKNPALYDIKHLEFTASKHVRSLREVWAFEDRETADCGVLHFGSDHHHNLVERVRILPATYRCRQLRRCLALMWLKQILYYDPKGGSEIELETSYRADVSMAAKLLEEKKPKLELLSKNAYLYVSVILLVDLVIGAEPPLKKEDPEKLERKKAAIKRVKDVLDDVKRKMEGDKEAADELKKWQDFYGQFPKKWNLLYEDRGKRQKQTHLDDYFERRGRAVSRHDLTDTIQTAAKDQQ